mmetsp:Transcript_11115/g.26081  ORF Transcript_11115/g.26081 Transcript_11115/m.26081 type:complete len:244 (+) Transcript_11115:1190-1921(+)
MSRPLRTTAPSAKTHLIHPPAKRRGRPSREVSTSAATPPAAPLPLLPSSSAALSFSRGPSFTASSSSPRLSSRSSASLGVRHHGRAAPSVASPWTKVSEHQSKPLCAPRMRASSGRSMRRPPTRQSRILALARRGLLSPRLAVAAAQAMGDVSRSTHAVDQPSSQGAEARVPTRCQRPDRQRRHMAKASLKAQSGNSRGSSRGSSRGETSRRLFSEALPSQVLLLRDHALRSAAVFIASSTRA